MMSEIIQGKTYTTAAEDAAYIRKALKAEGWGTKDVSVRCSNYAGGSSVEVRILSDRPNIKRVKEIASAKERVRYCEYSGEILSGGNRFVHVTVDWQAMKRMTAAMQGVVEATTVKAVADPGRCIPVEGCPGISVSKDDHLFHVWQENSDHGSHAGKAWDWAGVAEIIIYKRMGG